MPDPDFGTYAAWRDAARELLEPLAALMHPGEAGLAIAGPASANGANADRFESFARPLLLAAHYLQSVPEPADAARTGPDPAAFRVRLAHWFRTGLVAGTDPAGPHYWGPDANYHQLHVEIGLLTIALQIAPRELWEPLTRGERDQVAAWIATIRGSGFVHNNHYFMAVHAYEFLGRHGYGRRTDRATVDEYLDRLELMHRGGGWFEDGINQAFDYYNAYAFNFYGVWWARLHGARDPVRATRWRDWARLFLRDYEHFFAASGEHPPFGRSLTYRFNAVAPFALAVLEGCCDLPPGRVRRLCTRNLRFFLERPIRQEQGCLALGWTDRFDASAELYSCPASPYWAAKGFSSLLLPPDHAYWTAPEEPLQSERGDHAHAIPAAMMVVRSTAGAVELLNAGSQVSHVNLRYGAWKWSKHAYRTGAGYTLAFPLATNWSPDSALCLELPGGTVYGRHSTVPLELDAHHLLFGYNLGFAPAQVNAHVETLLFWHHGWLLQLHTIESRQKAVYRLGGYALPLTSPPVVRTGGDTRLAAFRPDGRGTVLQLLAGAPHGGWDSRLDETTARTHLGAPFHATPVFRSEETAGDLRIAALAWTGSAPAESAAWNVASAPAGEWTLSHPHHGDWTVRHWALPALPS
ncbi:MAG: DUF2264 domain-containing protein [Verrucomicrobia bacterium]|nr:DUF2264 domain-containing protein [Verrucomicrobiota bacterium]